SASEGIWRPTTWAGASSRPPRTQTAAAQMAANSPEPAFMRKRFNYRFALYLMLSVAAVGVGTHFLHAYQVSRNADSLKKRADQYREQGELSKAADCLGQYLGLHPTDADALAQYGLLLADDQLAKTPQSKYRALLTLERGLVRDPGNK